MKTQSLGHAPRGYLFLSVFWNQFLPWYMLEHPVWIAKKYSDIAIRLAESFSFLFLLKTLFSPWKSISQSYPKNSLFIGEIIQAFTLNCTARMVGFTIRLYTLCLGVLFQFILVAFFALYLLFWVSFPFIAVIALQYLLMSIV